eukprot:jgi/Tetstr1/448830/TSEL_036056.t1
MPATVWVWDCHKLELAAALMQVDEVAAFGWDPTQDRLAICSGSTRVYLWSPDGASCVHVPLPSFQACNVGWNPNGSAFVLTDPRRLLLRLPCLSRRYVAPPAM